MHEGKLQITGSGPNLTITYVKKLTTSPTLAISSAIAATSTRSASVFAPRMKWHRGAPATLSTGPAFE